MQHLLGVWSLVLRDPTSYSFPEIGSQSTTPAPGTSSWVFTIQQPLLPYVLLGAWVRAQRGFDLCPEVSGVEYGGNSPCPRLVTPQ